MTNNSLNSPFLWIFLLNGFYFCCFVITFLQNMQSFRPSSSTPAQWYRVIHDHIGSDNFIFMSVCLIYYNVWHSTLLSSLFTNFYSRPQTFLTRIKNIPWRSCSFQNREGQINFQLYSVQFFLKSSLKNRNINKIEFHILEMKIQNCRCQFLNLNFDWWSLLT